MQRSNLGQYESVAELPTEVVQESVRSLGLEEQVTQREGPTPSNRPARLGASAAVAAVLGITAFVCFAGTHWRHHVWPSSLTSGAPSRGADLDLELLQLNAESAPSTGWSHEHIGFFENELTNLCLALRSTPDNDAKAIVAECAYTEMWSDQKWVVDATTGLIRNLLSGGKCLEVQGDPGWHDGAPVIASSCNYTADPSTTDQIWQFDSGGFIVNTLSGKCIDVVGTGNVDRSGDSVALYHCEYHKANQTDQTWKYVTLSEAATKHGLAIGRLPGALKEEETLRGNVNADNLGRVPILTLDDVIRALDPTILLGGVFWPYVKVLFSEMIPEWNGWNELFTLRGLLGRAGVEQNALGSGIILNVMSNMVFAGMNFVQGVNGPNLNVLGAMKLNLQDFTGPDARDCQNRVMLSGKKWDGVCEWQKPKDGERIGVTSMQDVLNSHGIAIPAQSFFASIYTGNSTPSTEHDLGVTRALGLMNSGLTAAKAHGVEPTKLVSDATDPRFAFDVEGLSVLFETGFGWQPQSESYKDHNGASVIERLAHRYKDTKDILGLLMTDSALSMHLAHDGQSFVVDLSAFERYNPIRGYAKLGGIARFVAEGDRLVTTELEYNGKRYTQFDDKASDDDYIKRSKLSGWRYAQAAIIASLMAKTQLLVHVKTLHLELSPSLQAVTVDAFADEPAHPLRRLLEPFISRNVQATQTNIKLWFEFRAGEFGLAPLPIEEQLRLIQDDMNEHPLNLADMDMERYAKARGMDQFTGENAQTGHWRWNWHYRALKVQRLYDQMLECWLSQYYADQQSDLSGDAAMMKWWQSMLQHNRALRIAAVNSKDWVTSTSITTSTTQVTTTLPTVKPRFEPIPTAEPVATTTKDAPLFHSVFDVRQSTTPLVTEQWWKRRLAWGFDRNGNFREAGQSGGGNAVKGHDKSYAVVPPSVSDAPLAEPQHHHQPLTLPAWADNRAPSPNLREQSIVAPSRLLPQDKLVMPNWASPGNPTTTVAHNAPIQSYDLWSSPGNPTTTVAATTAQMQLFDSAIALGLNAETLKNVLRTLMVWVSWIHEDVGHSIASLIYNPVYTPSFVPEDGVGIALAPFSLAVFAYRNFVVLDRAKLLGNTPSYWFDQQDCRQYLGMWKKCKKAKNDKKCFSGLQVGLQELATEPEFSACGKDGFYSCVESVETSSSS